LQMRFLPSDMRHQSLGLPAIDDQGTAKLRGRHHFTNRLRATLALADAYAFCNSNLIAYAKPVTNGLSFNWSQRCSSRSVQLSGFLRHSQQVFSNCSRATVSCRASLRRTSSTAWLT